MCPDQTRLRLRPTRRCSSPDLDRDRCPAPPPPRRPATAQAQPAAASWAGWLSAATIAATQSNEPFSSRRVDVDLEVSAAAEQLVFQHRQISSAPLAGRHARGCAAHTDALRARKISGGCTRTQTKGHSTRPRTLSRAPTQPRLPHLTHLVLPTVTWGTVPPARLVSRGWAPHILPWGAHCALPPLRACDTRPHAASTPRRPFSFPSFVEPP